MRRVLLMVAFFACLPVLVNAQVREATVIFKDGFSIKGKVIQKKDVIFDPSGQAFIIPKDGSPINLDDEVRRMFFCVNQVQEAIPSKPGETRQDLIQIVKQKYFPRRDRMYPGWTFEKYSPYNERWERTVTVNTGKSTFDVRQRIITLTPWQALIINMEHNVDQQFLTKEMGAEFILGLLYKHYGLQKDMKEIDKRMQIARFMHQAGWHGFAFAELEKLVKEYPDAKANAEPMLDQLKQLKIGMYVEEIERTHRIGQHEESQNRIAAFFQENLIAQATEKQRIAVQDLKTKYESVKDKLKQAKKFLKELPTGVAQASRPFWTVVAATINEELTIDTLPRLETFLTFAQQHVRELEAQRKPAQPTEEVLAIGISGWLQGNNLAEPDVKTATKLFKARLMIQEYLKTDGSVARTQLVATFGRENDLPVDIIARVIQHMPPITPYDKTGTDLLTLDIEAPDAGAGRYLVQLPPDYHPYRPYPVLVCLQSSREAASAMLERLKELGAYHGYILAAPLWGGKGKQFAYKWSAKEHAIVLDCVRDLRRRFHVDSDRVFLFGWEDGGSMAFDVGLAHPDQFAGVLPMNGSCEKFATAYATNAQYLPFYIVEGDNNGSYTKQDRALFKEWQRSYASFYVEYKGRGSEWFAWEFPSMFDWMNRKKRHQPARELGRSHTTPGRGEEFRTLRTTDDKFYFLGTSNINDRALTTGTNFDASVRPATLQASIAVGNEADAKGAKIWSQINVRTTDVKQVSIWLAPNMIDFSKPVLIRVNGRTVGNPAVITPHLPTLLNEYYLSGDKQRLYFAKVDLKV